jgi:hypothetical protein
MAKAKKFRFSPSEEKMERRRELAEAIVKFHFGPLAHKVVHDMLLEGPLTLENLVKNTELAEDRVKECLRLLIHHNLVYYSIQDEIVFYHLVVANIFVRLRFPKFSSIMETKFGPTVCASHGDLIGLGRSYCKGNLYKR